MDVQDHQAQTDQRVHCANKMELHATKIIKKLNQGEEEKVTVFPYAKNNNKKKIHNPHKLGKKDYAEDEILQILLQ